MAVNPKAYPLADAQVRLAACSRHFSLRSPSPAV